ncbi:MAG: hypothetical protein M1827_000430 [Pycnora praestabilis]|nr:MAG: hypothetical protein M1827_000430 [Pycnora praestabilis]
MAIDNEKAIATGVDNVESDGSGTPKRHSHEPKRASYERHDEIDGHPDYIDPHNLDIGNHGHGTVDLPDDEYQVTVKTWIVVAVLSMSYGTSFWIVPGMSSVQTEVSTQLGNAGNAVYYNACYTIAGSVAFMICGANSDLFGRRWFIIGGNILTFIGYIVGGSAKSTTALIVCFTFLGFGGGNCQLAAFGLPELLPNKWRPMGVVMADSSTIFSVIVGPVASRFAIQHGQQWRWLLYGPAIVQAVLCPLLIWLYYPPKHPRGIPWKQAVRELDYFGMILFILAVCLILVGILYTTFLPSSSPKVIGPLVAGFGVLVCFAAWETFMPLKQPLTPSRIWRVDYGREFTAPFLVGFVVTMFFYGTNVTYPTMVAVFFTTPESTSTWPMKLSLPQGLGIATGATILLTFGNRIRHYKWTLLSSVTIMTVFGGLTALSNPDRLGMTIAFVFLSQVGYGFAQYLSISYIQMGVDQVELGIGGGLAGVSRTSGGSIAIAVYSSILANSLSRRAAILVPAAVTALGLPASSIPDVFLALPVSTAALLKVPGMTPAIAAAAGGAWQQSYVYALRMVAYASIGFGGAAIICCFLINPIDHKMTNRIEVFLENTENADKNVYH